MNLTITVPSTHRVGAKIAFVGESGGREEELEHEGFVGVSGRVLDRGMGLAAIERGECGIYNVCKRRPPSDNFKAEFYRDVELPIYTKTGKVSKRTKKVIQETEELKGWMEMLRKELVEAKPNVAVAVGGHALKALCGIGEWRNYQGRWAMSGIGNYRGSVLESTLVPGLKVIPVMHPSYVLRGAFDEFWPLCFDLKKVKREGEFRKIKRAPFYTTVKPTIEETLAFLGVIRTMLPLFSLDIETRAGTLACFAMAFTRTDGVVESLCVPIQTTTGPYWSTEDELQVWKGLAEVFKANPRLVNQNIEYDLDYLLDYGVEPSGVFMDTMLAHSILYPEFPKALAFILSFYLDDVVYYKGEGRDHSSRTPDEALWHYCCKDAVHTLRVVEPIEAKLKERGMWEFYREEINTHIYMAMEMMRTRLPYNQEQHLMLGEILQEEVVKVHGELTSQVGKDINVMAFKQVQQLLYEELGLPIKRNRKTGNPTSEENAIRELRASHPGIPALNTIIMERHLRKRISSYINIELDRE